MLAFIVSLLVLYFLNAFVIALIFDMYVSPAFVFVMMVIELIVFFIYSYYKKPDLNVSKKKNVKTRSSTKMTAEKFDMFNDLNDKK